MKIAHWKELFESLQKLVQKGGKFGKAAAQVTEILHLAQRKDSIQEIFQKFPQQIMVKLEFNIVSNMICRGLVG